MFKKPLISKMMVSKSTTVGKSTINTQTKNRLFGGIPQSFPEGTPMIQLLDLLNEQQLYELNHKICKEYHRSLTEKHLQQEGKIIIDDEPRIRRKRPTIRSNAVPSYEGPPLQRKSGRFTFKDRIFESPPINRRLTFTAVPTEGTDEAKNLSTLAKAVNEDSEYKDSQH